MRVPKRFLALFHVKQSGKQNQNSTAKAIAIPLARCARVPRATVRLKALSSCQGGHFVPRLIPQTRSVAPWTTPDALRLLDFRPGRFHQPLDPRPVGDFALPPDPHRPGVCRPGPAAGLSRPCTTSRRRSAPAPLTNPRRFGCAPRRGGFCDEQRQLKRQPTRGSRSTARRPRRPRSMSKSAATGAVPDLRLCLAVMLDAPLPAPPQPNGQPAGDDRATLGDNRQALGRTFASQLAELEQVGLEPEPDRLICLNSGTAPSRSAGLIRSRDRRTTGRSIEACQARDGRH